MPRPCDRHNLGKWLSTCAIRASTRLSSLPTATFDRKRLDRRSYAAKTPGCLQASRKTNNGLGMDPATTARSRSHLTRSASTAFSCMGDVQQMAVRTRLARSYSRGHSLCAHIEILITAAFNAL